MSAEAVQAEILDPMQRLFLPPRQMGANEQTAALRDYVAALQGYDGADLKAAWERVRDTHANRSWPMPSAFIRAASESRRDRVPPQKGRLSSDENHTARRLHWEDVIRTPLAREAVELEVAWSLKCLIMNDGKRANQIDLTRLRRQKESALRTVERIKSGEEIPRPKGRSVRFTPASAEAPLLLWDAQLKNEAATQREIMRAHKEPVE